MIHAPLTFNQRWAHCSICDNKICQMSLFIEPCQCRGDLSTVHEACLENKITGENPNINTLPRNEKGFYSYNCKRCNGLIYFSENFQRSRINCSEFDGCQTCLLVQLFITLFAVIGILIFAMIKVNMTWMFIFGAALMILFCAVIIKHLHIRLTAKFWKAKGMSQSFENMGGNKL